MLAAVDDDLLTGTAMVGHDAHRGWIAYLAVRADRRHAGLGRASSGAGERRLSERHVPNVQVMVRTTDAPGTRARRYPPRHGPISGVGGLGVGDAGAHRRSGRHRQRHEGRRPDGSACASVRHGARRARRTRCTTQAVGTPGDGAALPPARRWSIVTVATARTSMTIRCSVLCGGRRGRRSHTMATTLRLRRRRFALLARWGSTRWVKRWRRLRAGGGAFPPPPDAHGGGPAGVREPRRPPPTRPAAQAEVAAPIGRD